jgi:hypothetical protein
MSAEHGTVAPLLAACTEGFHIMASAATASARARLTADLEHACQRMLDHLAHEERDALPLVQR